MSFSATVSVFLLIVSSSVCVEITARGTEGEQVAIKCPYAKGYENTNKYFYKGPYKDNNLILKSDGGESVSDGRFSLWDDHQTGSFTVTIRNLRMADAGLYSCGAGWGDYKLIQLNVIKAPQKTRPVQISTTTLHPDQTTSSFSNTPPHSSSSDMKPQSSTITITDHHISSPGSFVIIVTAEVLVLLLIGLTLIIVALWKKKKNKGLLSSSIEEFNPVIYEQMKDAGRHCNPEDRDTETSVVYSCVS
ncbi:CMRF35-like molecule 1 [Onychostoma macrolepis]|uniref:CMRF35-like molecule 1 n=1 Tax=Onychostoma macrolepis TaxID=369639 RepID=UPI002729DF1B|nr:CMRF35-like molecule 1 [Onychostoma macrolepis]